MKISSYSEAAAYLESFIRPTLFKKITDNGFDPLERFRTYLKLIGNPQHNFKAVHVSGTSGKGSTSYMISRILSSAGFKTGLAISPHLERLNERMQINNINVTDDVFLQYLNFHIPVIEKMKTLPVGEPSYYEILLAITFHYFSDQKVDIAVVEVGIEGRFDATLLILPIVTVLTNISLDHTAILGETEEKIAQEAVALMKSKIPLVTGVRQLSIKKIVTDTARPLEASVFFVDPGKNIVLMNNTRNTLNFSYNSKQGKIDDVSLSLIGEFQLENAALAIETVLLLRTMKFVSSDDDIRSAFKHAHFPGRFEIRAGNPVIILDGAHNSAKMKAFLAALTKRFPGNKIFVVAFKKDKDIAELLKLVMQVATTLVITEFRGVTDMSLRASTPIADLKATVDTIKDFKGEVLYLPDSQSAVAKARKSALKQNGVVIVTGSLYLVGEVLSQLGMEA